MFLNMSVWVFQGLRYCSLLIRQIFIFPMPCSATILCCEKRRLALFHRGGSGFPLGFFFGTIKKGVPLYPKSPPFGTPGGESVLVSSYMRLSCVFPVNALETAAMRTFRFFFPLPVFFFRRTTAT